MNIDTPVPRTGARPYPTHTKLGALMHARGLTAATVCNAAGVYPRMMTEYLAGRKRPTNRVLNRLSAALGVPPADLLGDVGRPAGARVKVVD